MSEDQSKDAPVSSVSFQCHKFLVRGQVLYNITGPDGEIWRHELPAQEAQIQCAMLIRAHAVGMAKGMYEGAEPLITDRIAADIAPTDAEVAEAETAEPVLSNN